ncbi:hypothetical protein K438DRAFT_1853153 [Mycena galopus ATCC 62051]|nr:hypothetical protein K438DRAFT_1853153 [Mycena galopus ATCC 62051]
MSTILRSHTTLDRRRGSKTRFQLPLFSRQPPLTSNTLSARVTQLSISLPEDVLREITKNLNTSDILSVSLTSSHVQTLLIPVLYETVHLRSSRSCVSGLSMLATRPELCAHIQKLAVRPNYYLAWPTRNEPLGADWVATMIMGFARTLTHLRAFDWDGLEMPPDALWLTLRNSCPELKELFSNVGLEPLDPESELSDVSGHLAIYPSSEDLPMQLWDMILNRCPNLRELTLCSFSASFRLFDINRVTEGHWPELSSLTLGAFGYDIDFTITTPPAAPFTAFLAAHPTLSFIRLAWNFKRWMSPDDIMEVPFPPALDKFSGIMQQLPVNGCSTLTTLDLMCEPLYAARKPALCTALRGLPKLTKFELWVHVADPRAGLEEFFLDLWRAAPRLEDLHFMCTTSFGKKPLNELAWSLRLLPGLHTFALTKGHRYADESMRRSALRIFTTVHAVTSQSGIQSEDSTGIESPASRLRQVSIRWARASCRNHLKQEGTYERVIGPPPPTSNRNDPQSGDGVMVEAWERGLRAVGGAFERHYRFALPRGRHQSDGDVDGHNNGPGSP